MAERKEMVNFRASPRLAEAIREAAQKSSVSTSTWLRAVVAEAAGRPDLAGEEGAKILQTPARPFNEQLDEQIREIQQHARGIEWAANSLRLLNNPDRNNH
tara:strand:+ start:24350 stop:24652 length:303 start_codon:yes stop_codon:yes gene_type:complete